MSANYRFFSPKNFRRWPFSLKSSECFGETAEIIEVVKIDTFANVRRGQCNFIVDKNYFEYAREDVIDDGCIDRSTVDWFN